MSPIPTGHVSGNNLILLRRFLADETDVWSSLTKPKQTALWFGRWEDNATPGKIIRVRMAHEKGQPWANMIVEECSAPNRLVVTGNCKGPPSMRAGNPAQLR